MNELLKILLSLSLSGSLLILVLLLCKPLFKAKISKRWQYYIWLVVIARLLLPFSSETNLVGSAFQQIDNAFSQTDITTQSGHDNQIWSITDFNKNAIPAGYNMLNLLIQNIWLIWLFGAIMLLVWKISVYQSFVKYIKAGRVEVTDIELWERLGTLVEHAGVKKAVSLYTNHLISSPLLIGFFRPCIMLPTLDLSDSDFQYTILHELTHYKRRDMFYKWLVQIAICVHWFNPIVYLMGREINRACELSCDEAIIRNLNTAKQRAYGDTLLNAMGTGGSYKNAVASITLYESKQLLKERLDAIMAFKQKSKMLIVITFVITILFSAGAIAVGAYAVHASTQVEFYTDYKGNTGNLSGNARDNTQEIDISLEVYNGGVELLPVSSNKITADYDNQYYDVQIAMKNGKWTVSASGKKAEMWKTEDVILHVPNIKNNITVEVLDGDFSYLLPDNCADILNITAKDSGIHFASKNKYDNCNISIIAENKDFIKYSQFTCPDYFSATENKITYKNGTGINHIRVYLTGYTNVDFVG